MKVGDLVKFKSKFLFRADTGIIIETGAYAGNKDVKVYWNGEGIDIEYSDILEVLNGSR